MTIITYYDDELDKIYVRGYCRVLMYIYLGRIFISDAFFLI